MSAIPFVYRADSYKHSHHKQFPPELVGTHYYVEARKPKADGMRDFLDKSGLSEAAIQEVYAAWLEFLKLHPDFFSTVVTMGMQGYLKAYLAKDGNAPLTHLAQAAEVLPAHGVPFNKEGWDFIQKAQVDTDPYLALPVRIYSLPEGTVVPVGTPQAAIETADDRFAWLASFLETAFIRALWYPTTVASLARQIRIVCRYFLTLTADPDVIEPALRFMLHDFGARGASSGESAAIGGAGHQTQFDGTDNVEALYYLHRYYGANLSNTSFTLPAAEHSTVRAWGKPREAEAYQHIVNVHLNEPAVTGVSVVSDTYGLEQAITNVWCNELKAFVKAQTKRIVIRPDSGNPLVVPRNTLVKLTNEFGGRVNTKNYKVLPNNLRALQGDGVNLYSIFVILHFLMKTNISAENLVLGMGGALLQLVGRDDYGFAEKLSAVRYKEDPGTYLPVFKEADGKRSKAGVFHVSKNSSGKIVVKNIPNMKQEADTNLLTLQYDGSAKKWPLPTYFEVVRQRARQ